MTLSFNIIATSVYCATCLSAKRFTSLEGVRRRGEGARMEGGAGVRGFGGRGGDGCEAI